MKKLYFLLMTLFSAYSFAQTIYSENMGTPTATTLITAYTGFQNSTPITYSGTGDVRTSSASSGYVGASGGGNTYLAATKTLIISGINTSAYTSNIQLSFGYLTSSATATAMTVETSTDGTNWTPLSFTNNTNTSWNLVTISGIPSSSTLSLRFTNANAATTQNRVDDIKVFYNNPSCTLVPGTPTTACDAVTFNIDTYTATIPYTGGGSGTYVITTNPSQGTVGGDNPNTVASGNITISGITEGNSVVVTIVNGGCSYTVNVTAPECKPVNALPYSESFNYTVGTALGSTQQWANANTGDDVLVATGNLSYTGITSTGNSASFDGAGKECHTPFTATTSGTIYASFLMKVTDLSTMTATTPENYFAVLTDGIASNFKGRLFMKKTGTQYQLGLTSGTSTTNYDPTLFNVNDVVLVVLGYDFTANSLKAWLNPNLATLTTSTTPNLTDTPTTAIATLGGLLLRQDSATTTPFIVIDELRINTTLPTLGVSQNEIVGLQVYSNNNLLFVTSDSSSDKNVVVYDMLGKVVVNETVSSQPINVANLSSGAYIVKVTEDGKTATKKLVIQ